MLPRGYSMRSLALFLALSLFTASTFALRCRTNIVEKGYSTLKLTKFCGQPTMVEHYEDRIPVETYDAKRGQYVTRYDIQPYEIWTYNFGRQRFITRITVKNGTVQKIETGGYGY